MNIVTTIKEWQALRKNLVNHTIGFVPTMGHLHAGHLSLCKRSQQENTLTIVSIFVNPTQFNQSSDFTNYPRTIKQDSDMLTAHHIDYLFLPNAEEMYADHYQMQVMETTLSTELEGKYRPGHFHGVLTVILKLLNLVQPQRIYFGEKDYQQLLLIKKMVSALFLPVEVIACKTIRANDGLALSSRNSRLTSEQRKKAVDFARLLQSSLDTETIHVELQKLGFKVDYIADKWQRRLGAVWLDEVRLIDNRLLAQEHNHA
ncbi:MAG TPA: pantoate--beta-alanine ligase [Gammaproteobacteria bacterium]|nr:MAG: pantoate--beta-alanine ligase [Gammaproteobacteria bacterium RIFCSPHIGHO2_12_FULL_41_20]HLB43497.1 pantoate--beta-alanine ligase [Gammaproteobacteria bacterium]